MADLCREYGIELQPKGKDLFACCPWHEDREPSFSVTPGKNLWNCLAGCGGGDNIQLVMRCEKISFRKFLGVRLHFATAVKGSGTLF